MLKKSLSNKYHDCKIIVSDPNQNQKVFPCHKIILANVSSYFEALFDFQNSSSYELQIPFEMNLFIEIFQRIYGIKSDLKIEKDLNYFENMIYALYFLSYDQKTIDRTIDKMIRLIDSKYTSKEKHLDTSSLVKNLNESNLIPLALKNDLVERISLDSFIQNSYDPEKKRLVLTSHLRNEAFEVEELVVENLKFSLYTTDRYDLDQIGFWIDYKKDPEYKGDNPIHEARGKLIIYKGVHKNQTTLTDLFFRPREEDFRLTFDEKRGNRYGQVKEYVSDKNSCSYIDPRICVYKIILDFM
jgi:hypothetical protein